MNQPQTMDAHEHGQLLFWVDFSWTEGRALVTAQCEFHHFMLAQDSSIFG